MLNWCLEKSHRNSKHLLDQVMVLAEFGDTGHFALCSATVCRGRGAMAGAPPVPAPCLQTAAIPCVNPMRWGWLTACGQPRLSRA